MRIFCTVFRAENGNGYCLCAGRGGKISAHFVVYGVTRLSDNYHRTRRVLSSPTPLSRYVARGMIPWESLLFFCHPFPVIVSKHFSPHTRRSINIVQDPDFEGLPEHQAFTLTLEQPTKFGYSPGFVLGSSGGGGGGDRGDRGGSGPLMPIPDNDVPPPYTPDLFRYSTAPAMTATSAVLGHGEAGAFMDWPRKTLGDSVGAGSGVGKGIGGGGRGHMRRGTYTDHRCDSLGSAAEWDQTLEGEELRTGRRLLIEGVCALCFGYELRCFNFFVSGA